MAKKLTATLLSLALAGTMMPQGIQAAEEALTFKAFNATKSVITVDFNNVTTALDKASFADKITIEKRDAQGTITEVNDFTYEVTKAQSGTDGSGNAITISEGNTIVIKPTDGVETEDWYKVTISAGVTDSDGTTLDESASTGWFEVNEIYFDDFNVSYEEDGTTPKEPIYMDGKATKSRYWDADYDGTNTGILSDKLQIRNATRYAVLNKTGLPEDKQVSDYTVEYQLGLSKNGYYKIPQYIAMRNSELRTRNDPLNYVGKSGYFLGVDKDYNYSGNTGSLFIRVGNISNDPLMQISNYQFNDKTVAVRAVADGNHLQYYIDNDKVFDLTDSTYNAKSTIGFAGGCAWNESPATTMDNLSITTVTKYGDIDTAGLSLKGFNATKSVITVDFDHVNRGIDADSLADRIEITRNNGSTIEKITDFTVKVTSEQTGTYSGGKEVVTAKANTVIITPAGGIDTESLYNVELKKDISDEEGFKLAQSVSTGWFMVNEVFFDDFDVSYEADGTTPKEPIYKDGNATKSRYWDANYDGTNTGILGDKLQIRNATRHAVLNKTGLPADKQVSDFTVEYQLGLSKNGYYKIPQYAALRNSELSSRSDAINYVGKSGYLLGVDKDYNYSDNTGSLFLRVGNIENEPLMQVSGYQFNGKTIAVRAVAEGSHLQYFIDDEKIFDLTDSTYDAKSTIGFTGGCAWNESPATTMDNLSITTVTRVDNIPQRTEIVSYNADVDTIYLEVGDIDTVFNQISESSLSGVKLYDKDGAEITQKTVTLQDNYIIVRPASPLAINQKYTVEAKGITTKYGTVLMDYAKTFKVIKIYSETFDKAESLNSWSTSGTGSWIDDNGNGIMKISKTDGGENGYIFTKDFKETPEPEYVTEFDFYVYDNDSDPNNELVFNEFLFYSNKPHNQNYNQGNNSLNYSIGKNRAFVIDNYKDYGRRVFYNQSKSANLTIEAGVKHNVKAVNKNGTGFVYVDGILEAVYDYSAAAPLGTGCFGIYVGGGYGGTVVGVDNILCTYAIDYEDDEDEGEEEAILISDATVTEPTEDGKVTATVAVKNNSYAGENYVVAVAVYDENNKLIGIKTQKETEAVQGETKEYNNLVIENASAMSYAKVFLWDSIETMKPIGTMREISENTNVTLYVNPSADLMSADGSYENPYPAIDMAIERIESDVKSGAFNVNYTVDVAEGDIYLEDTVEIYDYNGLLSSSGTKITVEGKGTDKTFVKSGKEIENSDIYKVEDNAVLSRVPSGAEDNIYAVDIVGNGYAESGKSFELSIDGKVQTVAKYPNSGYLVTGDITTDGMGFECSDKRVSAWETAEDMYVYYMPNYFSYAYKVTAENGVIETANNAGFASEKNYYVYNLIEELDNNGEYYYDKSKGILYLYSENMPSGKLEIYNMDKYLISLKYCDNIKFKNMTIENGAKTLINIQNSKNTSFEGCVLRNGTKNAASVSGGKNSGFYNCDIYDFGTGGVTLSGGNRDVLSKARNYVDRCAVHDCQRIDRSYNALISMSGVGNYVTNSDIYNSYHQAITIYGNDLEIKNNKIYNVCTETTDMGAIYAEGDWTLRGTVIEHNYFENVPATGSMGAFAIYLDNGLSGITVKNNIFKNIEEQAVFVNGGRDNLITNNIFVDCGELGAISDILNWGSGYSFSNPAPAKTSMLNKLNKVVYNEEPYTKYEHLANILDDKPTIPKYNKFTGNVTVNTDGLSDSWLQNTYLYILLWSGGCESDATRCKTSDLTDYNGGDYTLSESKAALIGFEWFDNSFGR